jgi:hypothetical protein
VGAVKLYGAMPGDLGIMPRNLGSSTREGARVGCDDLSLGRSHLSFLACNGAAAWWLIVEVRPALEASRMPSMAIVDVI